MKIKNTYNNQKNIKFKLINLTTKSNFLNKNKKLPHNLNNQVKWLFFNSS